ncbi:MAG: hypothetical protein WBL19_01830 [Minisyncoccia bacterium]
MNEEGEQIQEQELEHHKKFGGVTFILMLIVALFFDGIQILVQLIPVAGQILGSVIGLLAFMTFFLWFAMKGMRFLTAGRIITMTGTLFVEVIPLASALPVWTLSIVLMFITSKFGRTTKVASIITSRK